ncbi:MAG: hypothetical protein WCF09_01770, partial [Gallionella sp.]
SCSAAGVDESAYAENDKIEKSAVPAIAKVTPFLLFILDLLYFGKFAWMRCGYMVSALHKAFSFCLPFADSGIAAANGPVCDWAVLCKTVTK